MEKLDKSIPIVDMISAKWKKGKKIFGYELENGRRYLLFKKREGDPFAKTPEERFDEAYEIGRLMGATKEGTEIVVTHISSPSKGKIDEYLRSGSKEAPTLFGKIRKEYAELYRDSRFGETYLGVEEKNAGGSVAEIVERWNYEPCSAEDVALFLHYAFNPSEIGKRDRATISLLAKRIGNEIKIVDALYLSQIETDEGVLRIGDVSVKTYKLVYPPADLESFSAAALLADLKRVGAPFAVSISLTHLPSGISALKSKIRASKTAGFNFFSNSNPIMAENAEKTIEFAERTRTSIVRTAVSVSFFSKDAAAEKAEIDPVDFTGAGFMWERFDPVAAWFSILPGIRKSYYDSFLVPGTHAAMIADVSPLSDPKKGINLYLDKGGEARVFSFHDSSRTVNSLLISARTGRGKSVLLNQGLAEYFEKFYPNFETLVVDYGGSYKSFVEKVNGELPPGERFAYLAPSSSEGKSYNPFDLEFGVEISEKTWNEKSKLVANFFETSMPGLSEEEKSLLRSAIPLTYEKFLTDDRYKKRKGGTRGSVPYVDAYEKNREDAESFLAAMPTIADMIPVISGEKEIAGSFPREVVTSLSNKITNFMRSPYTKIFSDTSSEPVTAKRIVLDVKPASMEDKTGFLASLFFVYYVNDAMMRMMREERRHVKKLVIMDEYPRLLKAAPQVEDYLDMLLKTGRKENADVFAVVQNVSTFNPSFVENSGGFVTFKPATPDEAKNVAGFLGIDEDYASVIETLETVKGEYTEFCHFDVEKDMRKSIYRSALSKPLLEIFSI